MRLGGRGESVPAWTVGIKVTHTRKVLSPVPDRAKVTKHFVVVVVVPPFIQCLLFSRHCTKKFPSVISNPYDFMLYIQGGSVTCPVLDSSRVCIHDKVAPPL